MAAVVGASQADALAATWADVHRLFGWPGDVGDLKPGGRA
jgi:hypothetical protein